MKQFIIFLLAAFSLLFASQCVAQTPKNGNVTNKKKKDGNIYPDTIFPNHAKFTRELPQGGSNDANVVIDSQGNLKKGGVGTDLKKYWAKVGDTINSNINPSVGISGWVDTAANSSNPALMIYGGRNSKSGKSSVFITEPNTNTMYLSNSSSVPDEEVIVDMSSKKDLFLLTRKGAIRFTPLNTKPTGFATDGAFVYDNIGGAVYIAKNGQYRRLMDTTDFNKNDFWRKSGDTINNQTGYQEYNAVVVDTSNNENNNSFANFGSQAPKLGKYAMAYFNAKTNSINIVNTNPNWQSDFSLGEDVIGFGTKRGAFRLFPTNTPPMGVLPANFGDLAYDNTGGKLYVIKANAQGIPEWRRLVDTTELANENNLKNKWTIGGDTLSNPIGLLRIIDTNSNNAVNPYMSLEVVHTKKNKIGGINLMPDALNSFLIDDFGEYGYEFRKNDIGFFWENGSWKITPTKNINNEIFNFSALLIQQDEINGNKYYVPRNGNTYSRIMDSLEVAATYLLKTDTVPLARKSDVAATYLLKTDTVPLARKSDVAATYLLKTDTVPLARKSDVIGKNNVKFFTGSTNASGEITINFTAFPLRINGASIVGYNSSTADTEQPFCALRTNIITNNVSSVTFRCLKGTTAGLTQPTVVPSASTSVMITLFGE